ncbi:peptigoglycan-binding protein LysM [Bacillus glycinifermentans]|uniref:SafA/ExsA family spore coat assembly protein n=1 Tax=Bacillus glycinifermentans TaxID=1664069 RepID=UPI0006533757|nr:SafA/ExsA family spore coat assembly protein [Bacillus glycinifermentans]ATH92631.1 peptigoglycan-binding protein LysM [Bacillus glycinifermentans]KMM59859.1 peptigoglycan-binding protein LysM [Bacillus glycinifermentans]MEC0493145.1 SafA/ExsA family spore coat assembly protein [Bacillus glycinifermentans]MEC0542443.1 SafA/ExsA family spore coat assembly protein [Bacillus glycinifermentans]
MKIHIVQKGDSLEKIAERYEVDFQELKKLNSQLSNPDLIMPGMKIKVPSGGVPVKKEEEQLNMRKELPKKKGLPKKELPKKELPKMEHPFAQEKPKEKVEIEDVKMKEKPSIPYVPPVPNLGQPGLPEGDISNLYQNVNQLHQPFVPPKPYEHQEKESNMYFPWTNEEESKMENVNYPNVPNPQHAGAAAEEPPAYHGMPNVAAAGYYHHPHYFHHYPYYPGCLIPVSPVLPGSGLCHPWHHYPAHMHYMPYAHHGYVSPAEYEGGENAGHDNAGHHHTHHHQPMTAPAYMPSFGAYPSQTYPSFAPPNVGHTGDPNIAHAGEEDCGCGPAQYSGGYPTGYPGGMPYGQMPGQMPQMGAPYETGAYGQQPAAGQMFSRPEEDED